MFFWIRKIVFGLALGITAFVLLNNQDVIVDIVKFASSSGPTNNDIAEPVPEPEPEEEPVKEDTKKITKPTPAPAEEEEEYHSNAAADGLSKFYASINPSFGEKGPRIKNNVVYLNEPKGNLAEILEARKKVIRPMRKNWRGEVAARPFRIGQTLFQKLSEYAGEQGVEVMWRLNMDFLVKDPFRINQDIIKTAYQIGKAIEGHFPEGVDIYFCYNQRALVLIDKPDPYLQQDCTLIGSQNSNW